jgi:hypothetical protein
MTVANLLKAYLDSCVVSGLAKDELSAEDTSALVMILEAHKAGRIALVSSKLVQDEIAKIPPGCPKRHPLSLSIAKPCLSVQKPFRSYVGCGWSVRWSSRGFCRSSVPTGNASRALHPWPSAVGPHAGSGPGNGSGMLSCCLPVNSIR